MIPRCLIVSGLVWSRDVRGNSLETCELTFLFSGRGMGGSPALRKASPVARHLVKTSLPFASSLLAVWFWG